MAVAYHRGDPGSYGVCGAQSGNGTSLIASTSVLPISLIPPLRFTLIHSSPTLYDLSKWQYVWTLADCRKNVKRV